MATESDLIFSAQANHNFSRILTDLKRANLSISNRLRSIREDADFVSEVAGAFGRPLVANERCGSWYIDPANKAGSAYFKSTDGHAGQWNFSSRRLNLHLLAVIGRHDGCVVVDSTRRGKQMPDALSKTVPIWCCVLNRALGLDVATLRQHVAKPLRPIWVTQESQLVPTAHVFDAFHPVICCTSSRRVPGGEMSEGGYIQGAGDDTENWALGLTAPLFWNNAATLLSTPEPDLPDLVRSLAATQAVGRAANTPIQVAPCISVSQLPVSAQPPSTCAITFVPKTTDPSSWVKGPALMEVGIGKQKLASRNLRVALVTICDFADAYLRGEMQGGEEISASCQKKSILIACETGKDLSIGVVLALVCRFFDDDGNYAPRAPDSAVNKSLIKMKLGRIMLAYPEANPSRATLQSVNSYLMG